MPHWIEYEVNSFPARQFSGRHKVRVSRHQHDLINLPLKAQGGNIQPDAHIDAFLRSEVLEILVSQVLKLKSAAKQLFKLSLLQFPFRMIHQMPQAQCHFSHFAQFIVKC